MCSTCGNIHPQVIKPSFMAIQKSFAFGYFNMMLIYFRLNVIAHLFSLIIPYIKRAAQLRLSEIYIEYLNRPKTWFYNLWVNPPTSTTHYIRISDNKILFKFIARIARIARKLNSIFKIMVCRILILNLYRTFKNSQK